MRILNHKTKLYDNQCSANHFVAIWGNSVLELRSDVITIEEPEHYTKMELNVPLFSSSSSVSLLNEKYFRHQVISSYRIYDDKIIAKKFYSLLFFKLYFYLCGQFCILSCSSRICFV